MILIEWKVLFSFVLFVFKYKSVLENSMWIEQKFNKMLVQTVYTGSFTNAVHILLHINCVQYILWTLYIFK